MDRRRFVALIGSALACPGVLRAQTRPKAVRLGLLANSVPVHPVLMEPIVHGLRERGWIEGPDFAIDGRAHGGNFAKAVELATQFADARVNAIVALATNSAVAAKRATGTMPVITWCGDPVAAGLVRSLAHPGGNVTGIANYPSAELFGKLVDVLHDVHPALRELAILWDFMPPGFPDGPIHLEALLLAAKRLGVRSRVWMVRNEKDLLAALSAIERANFNGLFVSASGGIHQLAALSSRIAAVVERRKLPTITNIVGETFASARCLLTYSSNVAELGGRLAYFIDRVLRGADPGDLPIEQPTKFELIINLKVAKALGIAIPQDVLIRADRVIE